MNCREFGRWMDAGLPAGAEAPAALAHARACDGCAAGLAAAREIEMLLEAPAASAPAGFSDAVMARVRREAETAQAEGVDRAAPRAPLEAVIPFTFTPGAIPWWVRAAAEPTCAAAAVIAGLLAWRGNAAGSAGVAAMEVLNRWLSGIVSESVLAHAGVAGPLQAVGILLGAGACLAVAAGPLYSWSLHGTEAAAGARNAGRR